MNASLYPEIAEFLERIYGECNRLERLKRDPLAIVRQFGQSADREVAGLLCSTLAFGAVDLILKACARALEPLGSHPAAALDAMDDYEILCSWSDFQYRFCFPSDIQALLRGIREARGRYGSLEALFLAGDNPAQGLEATTSAFVRELRDLGSTGGDKSAGEGPVGATIRATIRRNLLPDPADGSACKRLFLFLRWMVRHDDIDPGGWNSVSPSRLIVPLDVHMARTCRERLGFLGKTRASATPTLRDALEATARFAAYSPEDPVKYDFALTRPGIDPHPGDEVFGCF